MALLFILIIWFWKEYQIRSLIATAQEQYTEKQYEALKLTAMLYAWAMCQEMFRKNYQQANLFTAGKMHEKNFQSIMVSNTNGLVISSTEKNQKGKI